MSGVHNRFRNAAWFALFLMCGPQSRAQTAQTFVAVTPCRIADTRNATGTFGGPIMSARADEKFPDPTKLL